MGTGLGDRFSKEPFPIYKYKKAKLSGFVPLCEIRNHSKTKLCDLFEPDYREDKRNVLWVKPT